MHFLQLKENNYGNNYNHAGRSSDDWHACPYEHTTPQYGDGGVG